MTLPPGKPDAEALQRAVAMKRVLWRDIKGDEEQRIRELQAYCTRLHQGDKAAGHKLATDAIWAAGRLECAE